MQFNQSESLNLFMVSRFADLKHMYLRAAAKVLEEKEIALYEGWQEWHQLDKESRDFVRDYMKQ